MTLLQIAQKTIKDLRVVISNLHAKYRDGYEELQRTVVILQKEVLRLTTENEQLKKVLKDDKKQKLLAASVPDLKNTIKKLKKQITALKNENEKITDQLEFLRNRNKKTSETSDKPSSANIFKKPVSTRVRTGREPGGQRGHKGHTLHPFPYAEVIDCPPVKQCECGGAVHISDKYKSKQSVNIEVTLKVTEEHVQIGYCEKCGKRHDGSFSEGFVNPVNYGDDIKAIISLLNTRMNLPINKISELLKILTDSKINISDGTVVNIVNNFAQKSVPTVARIVERLTKCGLLLVDETGCRVNGKLDWFQIFTDDYFTLFSHNKKRGSLLFEGDDLLALFTGILLHDHFKSYYRYNHITHAECNEHIDRRLKAVVEIFKHEWALKLRSFFFDTNKRKKELIDRGEYFSEPEIKDYFNKFLEILDMGDAEYQQAIEGKQRIVRFNEEKCLLKRLREYANEHLRYITVPEVPCGNSGAERCAKEAKRKVRVSGGFRSDKGANNYARVTSVISTMRKQKMDIFQGIKDILNGKTLDFNLSSIDSS
ncbi:MAG TPA: IS66 family transposase [Deferribacteraceae bacterium]|nr:IS66 family transposase [Deferribacteraceae bacterium]